MKIGLSFFEAEEIIEDIFGNDVKLDFCATRKDFNDDDEMLFY